jgi:uncharacterized protein YbjT (DUF2867 family)
VNATVVLLSIVGAAPDSPLELSRYKYAAEQHLRNSGLPWTIIRSSAFVELWAEIVGKGIVFGRGDNPINFVSVYDVAAVVRSAVLDPSQRGRIIEMGGPSDLSFNQLAASLREQHGSPETVRHVPRWLLRTLATIHRLPRAAYVMDTADMTFRPGPDGHVGGTDLRLATARGDQPHPTTGSGHAT